MLVLKHRAEVALHACNVRLPTSMRPDYLIDPDPRCDLHWRDLIMMHKKIICSAAIACLVPLFWFLLLHMSIFSWIMMFLLWFCMMIAGFLIGNLHGRYLYILIICISILFAVTNVLGNFSFGRETDFPGVSGGRIVFVYCLFLGFLEMCAGVMCCRAYDFLIAKYINATRI